MIFGAVRSRGAKGLAAPITRSSMPAVEWAILCKSDQLLDQLIPTLYHSAQSTGSLTKHSEASSKSDKKRGNCYHSLNDVKKNQNSEASSSFFLFNFFPRLSLEALLIRPVILHLLFFTHSPVLQPSLHPYLVNLPQLFLLQGTFPFYSTQDCPSAWTPTPRHTAPSARRTLLYLYCRVARILFDTAMKKADYRFPQA